MGPSSTPSKSSPSCSRDRRCHAPGLACLALAAMLGSAATAGAAGWSLGLEGGVFDVAKTKPAELGVEVTGPPHAFGLLPAFGLTVTADQSVLAYAGLRRDFALGPRFFLTPGFALGAYSQGDGKDLGSTFEFRSSLELAYRLSPCSRLGLAVYHVSNAGISDTNPGANSVLLVYRVPWGGCR